ncbi:MAG: riboflavin kinase [Patescibacteria group bacterium]
MRFKSKHIKGNGRGKFLGFPTINMEIPKDLSLQTGIWAVLVEIKTKIFKGALHFGPVPTFKEKKLSLEVFLIDTKDQDIPKLSDAKITIEPIKRLRKVMTFSSPKKLITQIKKDVESAKQILL